MKPVLTRSEAISFLDEVFPQINGEFHLDQMDGETTIMRLSPQEKHLRPGNTVSGPTMFALVDVTAYVATLAIIGREALAVTTHCSMDFMRKPLPDRDLVATGTLLKLGRSLAVVDVKLHSEGREGLVASASLTYSIPPLKQT
ncbi:PaaI family thioesterase [Cognatishimia activa]|uniref:PaaI family thioesterase n=1 Tax=Cognatishimia activa TaxID=1715691 RepID=UPI002232A941|nr:PaaI family thioesterase [Cognatishimia activa]UZD91953.1 PaaI family thioesterase [Cognatishimia activa]